MIIFIFFSRYYEYCTKIVSIVVGGGCNLKVKALLIDSESDTTHPYGHPWSILQSLHGYVSQHILQPLLNHSSIQPQVFWEYLCSL